MSDRFGARKRFFYDEANRDAFRDEYEAMSVSGKVLENKPLVASSMAMVFLTLLMLM
ncbi:hypothetical protein [Halomarina rubra]|uniref:Restriction endonuclease n=1 Tax=Halomarina rubra TaxID=2071873 RepID=A0ABD6B0F5_9EURY|nr:hypothetical protein [Halomarina rubra]